MPLPAGTDLGSARDLQCTLASVEQHPGTAVVGLRHEEWSGFTRRVSSSSFIHQVLMECLLYSRHGGLGEVGGVKSPSSWNVLNSVSVSLSCVSTRLYITTCCGLQDKNQCLMTGKPILFCFCSMLVHLNKLVSCDIYKSQPRMQVQSGENWQRALRRNILSSNER